MNALTNDNGIYGIYTHLKINTDDHDVTWLALDLNGASTNVLNPDIINELSSACSEIINSNTKGLIIYSNKPSGFIAGADVKGFQGITDSEADHKLALSFIKLGQDLCQKIESLPIPTVAMVKGFCMGGGLELALACDYIVADDEPPTKFSFPEIKLGIHPGFGGTVRSIRKIGVLNAVPLILTGRNILPRQAKRMGLINTCVPHRQLEVTALRTVLDQPAKQKPTRFQRLLETPILRKLVASKMRKQVAHKAKQEHYPAPYALINLWEFHGSNTDAMFQGEAESVATLVATETAQNLVRVFFLQNRLKASGDKSLFSPKHVHIIGAGVMGGDIAIWCAMQGLRVTLQDTQTEALAKVVGRANKVFKRRYKKDKLRIRNAQDNLIPDLNGDGATKADVIIEAIFEDLSAKRSLFKNLEQRTRLGAILATNTSSIVLSDIAQAMQQPERLVGLHFFNPVIKMPLVEVIHTPNQTDPDIIRLAKSFSAHINKLPLAVKSSPGFLINRILMPYILEGVIAHQEGIPVTVIDQTATHYGMPMGPLELADTVGLDICLHVGKIVADTVGVSIPSSLDRSVESGNLGKKTGQGFYRWSKGKKDIAKQQPWSGDRQQLEESLISKLTIEAQKCLDEDLVEDADLLDAGVIFGTGFAPFRGGPLHSIR